MNQTATPPPPPHGATEPPPAPGPDGQRFRSLAQTRRATEGRVVAGVCAGLGRHLGIDPIIVRVVFVALCFAGLAGLLLYAVAWFALPGDDERPSVMADWFRLGVNEPQVRTGALIIGGALAFASIVGDSGWLWGPATPLSALWLVVPALFFYWLFAVLPRGSREPAKDSTGAPGEAVTPPPRPAAPMVAPAPAPRAPHTPPLLFWATMSVLLIALGTLAVVHLAVGSGFPVAAYPALALGVVGAGLLVGTRWGRSIALVPLGLLLCLVLAATSVFPEGPLGDFRQTPKTAGAVASTYEVGAGTLELDLTEVADPEHLLDRTVRVDSGFGQVRIIVPGDLAVSVDAEVAGGDIRVFGEYSSGRSADLSVPSDQQHSLHLIIDHAFGQVIVERA
ncbi:MAG: PspC domain-containing protein [Aeromicrobium sp.]|uniref:PspC domain-containing protein n=1 Tax=Aeromicrobium sp. TaxID=1871063 RepID=UPI0039E60EC3